MSSDVRDPETYRILGAAMEVHRVLGCGFLERVYHEALKVEFRQQGVPFRHEPELPIEYKGEALDCTYRADFICYDSVLLELKALAEITSREQSQVINYLKATGLERALILNFGTPRLTYKRMILTHSNSGLRPSGSSVDESVPSRPEDLHEVQADDFDAFES